MTIPGDEVVEVLQALIRNACVNDGTEASGHEHRSVATLQEYLGERGTVIEPQPGRQSLVMRVEGRRPGAPALALVPHLDVVPVSPERWTHPPFAAEREGGFVWGRGAVDMLNLTAAMAAVFKRYLSDELAPLEGDLVLVATADEEAGSELGAAHLVAEHWDLVHCDYLLTEVANPYFPTGGEPVLPVTVAEKGPAWRRLTGRGRSGHASQPYDTANALVPIARAVAGLAAAAMPVEVTAEWRQFVTGLPLDAATAEGLLAPDLVDAAIARIAAEDSVLARWVHACTHMTVTPTMLHAGLKANIVPDEAVAELDIRKLPGQDEQTVDDHLRKVLGPDLFDDIEVEPVHPFPAGGSAAEGPLWEAIADAAEAVTGSRSLVPAITPVATDARFFRARGVVAYGAGLFDEATGFGEFLTLFHGDDERVSEESIRLTTQLLETTVARFGVRSR